MAAAPGGTNAAVNFPKIEIGTAYLPATRFFFSYSLCPRREDRIVELELDTEGDPIVPYNRIFVHEILLVRAMRGDRGKIEYWTCNTQSMGPSTQGSIS